MAAPSDFSAKAEGDRTLSQARDAALRFISYRSRSEAEVRRRLSRQYPEPVIEQVVTGLRADGSLDDSAFARLWRRHREQHRPRGQRLLKQELYRLGVDRETAEEALEGYDDADNAYRAGFKFARSMRSRAYSEEVFRRRLWGYLQRRGFPYSLARGVVDQLWQELTADPLDRDEDSEDQ
ncbi:MAG: regulatory protein RecX [Dehalococcoidia bacterium]